MTRKKKRKRKAEFSLKTLKLIFARFYDSLRDEKTETGAPLTFLRFNDSIRRRENRKSSPSNITHPKPW